MKLRPVKRKVTTPPPTPAPKRGNKSKDTSSLGSKYKDEYSPEFPPIRFLVREEPSRKDPEKVVRQYLELSVKRYNDQDGLPYVWISMYQESEFYTGYLKGKTTYLPLSELDTLRKHFNEIADICEKARIE